jgi:hypothetical protein
VRPNGVQVSVVSEAALTGAALAEAPPALQSSGVPPAAAPKVGLAGGSFDGR